MKCSDIFLCPEDTLEPDVLQDIIHSAAILTSFSFSGCLLRRTTLQLYHPLSCSWMLVRLRLAAPSPFLLPGSTFAILQWLVFGSRKSLEQCVG